MLLSFDQHLSIRDADRRRTQFRQRVRTLTGGGGLIVISCREPYSHEADDQGSIRIRRPAGGVVAALEPLLRASGGTWIAHGSGGADPLVCDARGRIPVPPQEPEYTLRRLFLDEQDARRFYEGLSNQMFWPLCHRVYVRPRFREQDWDSYCAINRQFAEAAVAEMQDSGMLLVQDYHFALLPRYVRDRRPEAPMGLFWHIPWPSPETFAICPWKTAILDGMLAADSIGFHTREYCLNFLETARRFLPCKVDVQSMAVDYRNHRTIVRPYPISIEWPGVQSCREEGSALRKSLGIAEDVHVSIGVDRIDYTKGLLERMEGVDRLLTHNHDLAGRYVLVQIATPSRTRIPEYRDLLAVLQKKCSDINGRHGRIGYQPIVLRMQSFSPGEVRAHYAMAQSAIVTPLHDGMNLVAKEYVAACADGEGVLILSQFAGAALELDAALLVNPYDIQEVSSAIYRAIHMPIAERSRRMESLRLAVSRNTIYDWSLKLVGDVAAAAAPRRGREKLPFQWEAP